MNETNDHEDDLVQAGDVIASTHALFTGDTGTLDVDQRNTLVVLLKKRFITNRTHPREWRTLTADPDAIRSRLHDLFLDLELDLKREVAYKRQRQPESGTKKFPTLLYDKKWTREETTLLVHLRSRLRADDAADNQRAFIDRESLLEHVAAHRPASATDKVANEKRTTRAIETLVSADLLLGDQTAERFEISRAVEAILPVPRLQELLRWLATSKNPTTARTAEPVETAPVDLAPVGTTTDQEQPDD